MKNYTQFFTSIELGDFESVYFHLNSGLDPTREYKMDGKMTNPIRSSLKKGNSDIVSLLLDSQKVKLSVQDVLMASKNTPIDDSLISKLAMHVDFPELNNLHQDNIESTLKSFVKANKLSTAHVNYDLTKRVLMKKLSRNNSRDEEEDDNEEDVSDEEEDEQSSGEDGKDDSESDESEY